MTPAATAAAIEAHYAALRTGAGLVDRSGRGCVDVTGPDAAEFLQGQVTNDVLALEPGGGAYAAMLSPKGRILADMRVLARSSEELWLDTEAEALETVLRDLRTYRIGRQVEIADRGAERAVLSLIGPRAREVAARALEALGAPVPGGPPAAEGSFAEVTIGPGPALAVATDVGVDVLIEAGEAPRVRGTLLSAGALQVGDEAAEIVRIEEGRPRHGVDMTEVNLPGEAGIVERAVSFTKGCYVGQEPVARMFHKGRPNRHLRGLRLAEPAAPGTLLHAGEREAGRVTSACVSPALGPLALAMVRREAEPGATVAVGDGRAPATVVELPFSRG